MALSDDSKIEVSPTLDFTKLVLSEEEGFLLSRLMGQRQTVSDVLLVAGMPAAKARQLLAGLDRKGVLLVDGRSSAARKPAPAEASPKATPDDPYAGFVFPPAIIAEACDLTVEQKKRIYFVDFHLGTWNHYTLLGLKRTASAADVKRGYFRASKEFHPDAYFRKDLGRFKESIDRIFRAMKAGYDVLNDPAKRAAYDATVTFDLTPEEQKELAQLAEAEKARRVEGAREDRLRNRQLENRLKRNPMVARLKRGREFLTLAEDALKAGNTATAARHAQMAKEFLVKGPDADRADQIIALHRLERAKAVAEKASGLMSSLDQEDLLTAANRIAENAPDDGNLLFTAARLYHQAGDDANALRMAKRSTSLLPDHKKAWALLYDLCAASDNWHTAVRAAETLCRLDPKDASYKQKLKDAKRQAI